MKTKESFLVFQQVPCSYESEGDVCALVPLSSLFSELNIGRWNNVTHQHQQWLQPLVDLTKQAMWLDPQKVNLLSTQSNRLLLLLPQDSP